MDDFVKKVEELFKGLLSLKQNLKQDSFVPAIKAPSIPKPSVKQPPKIPSGLPPPSKKDPKKVAEQLKNPRPGKVQVEVLKVESNGQWNLEKATFENTIKTPTIPTTNPSAATKISGTPSPTRMANIQEKRAPVHAEEHGFPGWHSKEQKGLIHGLDLNKRHQVGKGISGSFISVNPNHEHDVIVKDASIHPDRDLRGHLENNFNSAKREVMFHNLARDYFGMGKHVPTTSGFTRNGVDYSAQQVMPNAEHADRKHAMSALEAKTTSKGNPFEAKTHEPGTDELVNPNHTKLLHKMHESGDLHKLALMDNIMGHHDRHGGNYMMDNDGKNLHLIDNGTAFDYGNYDVTDHPAYLRDAHDKDLKGLGKSKEIHPEAAKWLKSLDPEKLKEQFVNHGHDVNSTVTQNALRRLHGLKNKVESGTQEHKDMESLLSNNRLTTGPIYEHRGQ